MDQPTEWIDYFEKFLNKNVFDNPESIRECFENFDKNCDGNIDQNEFDVLLKSLFSYNCNPYYISKEKIKVIYNSFKSLNTGAIEYENFKDFWFKIIEQSLHPRSALIIVDVQNDFIDGSLAIKNCSAKQDGAEVVPVINELIDTTPFDVIAYTLDWHPKNHCSFIDNVNMRKLSDKSPVTKDFKLFDTIIFEQFPEAEQKLWPAHCIQGTKGAALHNDLKQIDPETDEMKKVVYTYKGCNPDIDSYSAFFDNCKLNETSLDKDLKQHQITDIYVCGLAADVCVAATAYDGLSLNYRVVYVTDATKGVDLNDIADQKKILINHGAMMVTSKQVKDMIKRKNRRPELCFSSILYQS